MVQLGININAHPQATNGRPAQPGQLQGVKWARMVFNLWSAVDFNDPNEPKRNLFNNDLNQAFKHYDALIAAYNAVGVRTLLVLNQETFSGVGGAAPWPPFGDGSDQSWATYADGFGQICGQIAAHYKGQGVAYEIWNEGDFQGGSSVFVPAHQFAGVLNKAASAIKANDPTATRVFGGLFAPPEQSVQYVKDVRAALSGNLPVEAVGVHPYGKYPPPFKSLEDVRARLQGGWFGDLDGHMAVVTQGIADRPLWITEIGLSEEFPTPQNEWPEAVRYMDGSVSLIRKKYAKRVPVLIWFAWSDALRNAGIVDGSGNAKGPIFEKFFQLAQASAPTPGPAEPSGEAKGIVLAPTTGLNVRSSAEVRPDNKIGVVRPGDNLTALQDPATVASRLGVEDQWLNIRMPNGQAGWAAAWLLKLAGIVLTPTTTLNVRSSPEITPDNKVGLVRPGDRVMALEPLDQVAAKLGAQDQWLNITTPGGQSAWAAAWLLKLAE